jgi:hypothetical protein
MQAVCSSETSAHFFKTAPPPSRRIGLSIVIGAVHSVTNLAFAYGQSRCGGTGSRLFSRRKTARSTSDRARKGCPRLAPDTAQRSTDFIQGSHSKASRHVIGGSADAVLHRRIYTGLFLQFLKTRHSRKSKLYSKICLTQSAKESGSITDRSKPETNSVALSPQASYTD